MNELTSREIKDVLLGRDDDWIPITDERVLARLVGYTAKWQVFMHTPTSKCFKFSWYKDPYFIDVYQTAVEVYLATKTIEEWVPVA